MADDPNFVSRQTQDARRFYFNLKPSEKHPLSLVCVGVERMDDDYVVQRVDFPSYAIEWVSEGRGITCPHHGIASRCQIARRRD